MKAISGIYWDAGAHGKKDSSLLYEQLLVKRKRVIIAVVCNGIEETGKEKISGWVTERIFRHFEQEIIKSISRQSGLGKIKKSMLRCFFRINQLLQYGIGEGKIQAGAMVDLILVMNRKYLMMHLGTGRIYCFTADNSLQKVTKDSQNKYLGGDTYRFPDIYQGIIRRKTGFLVCNEEFFKNLPDKTIRQCLDIKELEEDRQIQKYLRQLKTFKKNEETKTYGAAIYIICS